MTKWQTDAWLIYPKRNPSARIRLFCVPYAGAGVSMFRLWPTLLPSSVEVCLVQLPGRENRINEPPFRRLSPLVEVLTSILKTSLNKPFAFFGHSMGALICFEVIRRLRKASCPEPQHLFVSGCQAPQLPSSQPVIHQLADEEFISAIRALNGTSNEIFSSKELTALLVPILRADFSVYESYSYVAEKPLSCPITVFTGLLDTQVEADNSEAWSKQTLSHLTHHKFIGNHFFLHQFRKQISALIANELLN